jgi:predicted  nucleic acid-binding Zn-ribbon protein
MAEQDRVKQVNIGATEDGGPRVFQVRAQTFRVRQQLAQLQDEMFAAGMDVARVTSELTGVARKLDRLGESENGYDHEAAAKLTEEANALGRQLRTLEDRQVELRMRMLAARLQDCDPEWVLDQLDERRLGELEEAILGRPPTATAAAS